MLKGYFPPEFTLTIHLCAAKLHTHTCGGIFTECISFLYIYIYISIYISIFRSVYSIAEQLEEYIRCEMTGECSAGGTEGPAVLDSFCAGTAAHCPLGGPAMTRAGRILLPWRR